MLKRRTLLLLAIAVALAFGWLVSVQPAQADHTTAAVVTITVNSSEDPDNSDTRTCTLDNGTHQPANDGKCTLRRAIVEASARPATDRPIAIVFDLATSDPNHNRDADGTWTIVMKAAFPPLKTPSSQDLNGQVRIDGSTQSGGRALGPVILVDTGDRTLEIQSQNNEISNLGFLNGGSILIKEDGNLIERIWMGLSADGQSIKLRTPARPVRLATGGITVFSSNNILRNNVITGAFTPAINVSSTASANQILDNNIGTRADGSVPPIPEAIACLRSTSYNAANWYGGWGIAISGNQQTVTGNRLAGLHIVQSANDIPPTAIDITGVDHLVERNTIGIDSEDDAVGVCGQGIKLSGSGTRVLENTIVRSRTGFPADSGEALDGAILAVDSLPAFGQITVRGNVVEASPGEIYALGPLLPEAFRNFTPAQVATIDGVTLTGGNGADADGNVSACPNCVIDFYLDDLDEIGEAITYLGSTVANADGDFTMTLSEPLSPGQGIRTASTTASAGVISGLGAASTSKFSGLYVQQITAAISGPTTGDLGTFIPFTIQVTPGDVATPVVYTLSATGIAETVTAYDSSRLTATLRWHEPGLKTIQLAVNTGLATTTTTHQIQIGDPSFLLYLPKVAR